MTVGVGYFVKGGWTPQTPPQIQPCVYFSRYRDFKIFQIWLKTPIQAPKDYVFGGFNHFSLLRPPKGTSQVGNTCFEPSLCRSTTRGATGTLSEGYKKFFRSLGLISPGEVYIFAPNLTVRYRDVTPLLSIRYVTLWPWQLTFWHYTIVGKFVVKRSKAPPPLSILRPSTLELWIMFRLWLLLAIHIAYWQLRKRVVSRELCARHWY